MILIKDFSLEFSGGFIENLNLDVRDSEIFCLLLKERQLMNLMFDTLRGFYLDYRGSIAFPSETVQKEAPSDSVDFVNRFEPEQLYADARLEHYLNFMCSVGKMQKVKIFELLLKLNIDQRNMKKRIRDVDPDVLKKLQLSIMLASDSKNIVINDFIHGEKKGFELEFDKLLARKRDEGKAILYLTDDIFYAYRIADRVSFIKKGHALPLEPIQSADLEEMDVMLLYKKYLS